MDTLAAAYPPKLRFLFKPTVPNLQTRFLTGGPRSWPCIKGPWPNDAYGSQRAPARLWIYATDSTLCVVGFGWANRAEATAGMLMRGMLSLHDRLAMRTPRPSAFRLLPFERVVTINLLDSYLPARRRSPHESELAYSCKSAQAHGCGVGLVPHFGLANYHEAGLGPFKDLSEELAAAGLRRARTRMCGWAGNPKNHEQRALYGASAASHPHLLAFANQSQFLPLRAQVDEWACLIDLVGYGFSARVPLLLHSGRVVLKVTPPPPSPWLWYEDLRAFPEVLTPWDHFVPVKADLSDLVEQAEWIRDHPRRADRIGAAGQAYAHRYLTTQRASEFLARQVLIAAHCVAYPSAASPSPGCNYDWKRSANNSWASDLLNGYTVGA